MALHHLLQRREGWWSAAGGGDDLADLAEVGGSENAGGGDREELRVLAAVVGESVDHRAWDADRVPGPDFDRLAVDCVRRDALQSVDRLLERVVAVRHRHLGVRRDEALKDGRGTVGVGRLDQEADGNLADGDGLSAFLIHGGLLDQGGI